MQKIDILIKEIGQRITELENDKLMMRNKQAILIRENKRFLERCQYILQQPNAPNASCDICGTQFYEDGILVSVCDPCQKEIESL